MNNHNLTILDYITVFIIVMSSFGIVGYFFFTWEANNGRLIDEEIERQRIERILK